MGPVERLVPDGATVWPDERVASDGESEVDNRDPWVCESSINARETRNEVRQKVLREK
jgi:hypothetical protein